MQKLPLPQNQNVKIISLPFKYVNAITDLEDRIIYLSSNIDSNILADVLTDEYAHIRLNNPWHNKKWRKECIQINGRVPRHNRCVDKLTKNIQEYTRPSNVGNVTGIQNILLDYHLLQAYRKFSQRILATEGQWECKGDNLIRLYPTPRGTFPVVVEYMPHVYRFRSPEAREILKRMLVAECKIILGNMRSKFSGIPTPDGGTLQTNGEQLRAEGFEEKEKVLQDAINLGEPSPIILW